ncbi:MAG: hypothetical protein VB092_07490 [Oscillospiraceae bacterium]|nr:hypothetical protein [Oscillospiraceae bacterium]
MYIRTVTGDVTCESIGHAQCHEHIYLLKGPSFACNPALCMDDYESSKRELLDYKRAGGSLIVDAQPGYFGRDAKVLRRLSEGSGVLIVASTGFHKLSYMEENAPLLRMNELRTADFFVDEIMRGMLDTDWESARSRAGIIKIVFEKDGLENAVSRRLIRAAGAAASQTGAAIMIHTESDADVSALLDYFSAMGMSMDRLLVCHLDRTHPDPDYHLRLLDRGCSLCYDSIHRYKYVSDAQELALIRRVCTAGYEQQIVLSLDTTNQRLRAYYAKDMGLDYILCSFIPQLRQAGICEDHIRRMCRTNARRILQLSINK